jgi:ATP-dependent helicase Lhr and Lhr-like helicase
VAKSNDPLAHLQPATRAWFEGAFESPTKAQRLAIPSIASGKSTLLLAPTGSGKTLAAFLVALDRLLFTPAPPEKERCRVLYVSPLKALAVDVERNLRAPLAGIAATAQRMEIPYTEPSVEVRTGDTPAAQRARMARRPPDILVTTPESLYLMLTSRARAVLASVDTVIIDEIHAMLPTKRGAHLALSLERLARLVPTDRALIRIGLSATQRPHEEAARMLGGYVGGDPRPVTVLDASAKRSIDVTLEVPVDDMSRLGEVEEIPSGSAAGVTRKSIWPSLHPRIVELVRQHRSTMIFVNSRRLAERLSSALNDLAGEPIAAAHHGSLAREERMIIEDRLKRGLLPAIVATSSLELGIDMGAVDLVVQIEAPPSIASGVQRIGRACHHVGGTPKGVIVPKHRGDLVAAAAALDPIRDGEVEPTFVTSNPLDVLAQQIVAFVASEPSDVTVDEVFALVRGAAPFVELSRSMLEGVLDLLSGRYPSDDFAGLRPRIVWDRVNGTLRARQGALRLAVVNGGTIPDRGLYGVFLAGEKDGASRRVGELDEEMVFESRVGEVFLLGSSSWRIEEITHDRVLVTPAPGEPGKMPFWHGDRPGRSLAFGRKIGALTREVAKDGERAKEKLAALGLDARAAQNLVAYVMEQRAATGEVPSDKTLVLERFRDELGDVRACILSPMGARIHAPWATAVVARFQADRGMAVDAVWSDDGLVFRFPDADEVPDASLLFPSPDEVESIIVGAVSQTSVFAARFREAAARALLLPRRYPGKRTALWMQRKRSADLLAVAAQYPSFPIVLEAMRECLKEVFDLPGLLEVLRDVERRRLRVVSVDTQRPSPFASSLLFGFVAEFLYEGDAPLAERRAQALRVDPAQLRELLGEAALRELLDPDAIVEHEAFLQRRDGKYGARHEDDVHDLLLGLGDLSLAEIAERCNDEAAARGFVDALVRHNRAITIRIGRGTRYIAAEDAARYRDGLGVALPMGLPAAFTEKVKDPLRDLVARYARTHGPFRVEDAASRFGLAPSAVRAAFAPLLASGKVLEGEFLPGGHGQELCDAEVLRALRRRSLSALRKEIEPVDGAALGRFLPSWHGLDRPRRGREGVMTVLRQLEGAPLLASALESEILPLRIEEYEPFLLDGLLATGEITWAGLEPVGPKDGRIALYLTEHEPLLSRPPRPVDSEMAKKIKEELGRGGALFFADLVRRVGGYPNDLADALWELVWAGEVSNDTLLPLRSLLRGDTSSGRPGAGPLGARVLPGTEGRWWLRGASRPDAPSDTARRTALARSLLERHGVVTREVVQSEGIAGGFSAVYALLKEMEERGQVRRGYFVAGRGALQFAVPGADEELRARRDEGEPRLFVLPASDPANPYGASLPWPESPSNLGRGAGAQVLLYGGELVAYLGRGERALLTFLPPDEPERSAAGRAVVEGLGAMVDEGGRRALLLASVDGVDPGKSVLAPWLSDAGFSPGTRGFLRRRKPRDEAQPPSPGLRPRPDPGARRRARG